MNQDIENSRYDFDIQIVEGTQLTTARLALLVASQHEFALRCRKGAAGTLFSYWATPSENVLSIPKESLVFRGPAEQKFQLFPSGPALNRAAWLTLLLRGVLLLEGPWQIRRADDWYSLYSSDQPARFRWRQRKKVQPARFRKGIFIPKTSERVQTHPLASLSLYWRRP